MSFFAKVKNYIHKNDSSIRKSVLNEELPKELSIEECTVVAGGPEVENEPD